jgi:hypothetical protein
MRDEIARLGHEFVAGVEHPEPQSYMSRGATQEHENSGGDLRM